MPKKQPAKTPRNGYGSTRLGDHPVLRERLESIRAIIAEADDLAACDPDSVTGMFVQEMSGKDS